MYFCWTIFADSLVVTVVCIKVLIQFSRCLIVGVYHNLQEGQCRREHGSESSRATMMPRSRSTPISCPTSTETRWLRCGRFASYLTPICDFSAFYLKNENEGQKLITLTFQIPQIFHFLHISKEALHIQHLSMYEMERMLAMPRASKQLANIMTCLLRYNCNIILFIIYIIILFTEIIFLYSLSFFTGEINFFFTALLCRKLKCVKCRRCRTIFG